MQGIAEVKSRSRADADPHMTCVVFVGVHIGTLNFNSVASDVLEIRGGSQNSELGQVPMA